MSPVRRVAVFEEADRSIRRGPIGARPPGCPALYQSRPRLPLPGAAPPDT